MQRFISTFAWVIIIVGVGLIGYFAYTNLSHDFVYEAQDANQNDALLVYNDDQDNSDTDTENNTNTTEDISNTTGIPNTSNTSGTGTSATTPNTPSATTAVVPEKYKDLASRLDKLITEYGGTMKQGSKGTRVGVVQEFLNVFEGKDQKAGLDNDYGPGMVTSVKKFQQSAGLTADGQAGPGTFKAMLDWLKK